MAGRGGGVMALDAVPRPRRRPQRAPVNDLYELPPMAPWDPTDADAPPDDWSEVDAIPLAAQTFPEPEDRGGASLSDLGSTWYVDDLLRPGRILVVAAEEGTGKSYAITGELGIRVAAAGGSFAGTWPVLQGGPVLVLSEMHPDDDYDREQAILSALELDREQLSGRYFRLSLSSAAGDRPALQVPEWRDWATAWLREHEALLAIFDTATAAAQVDPWGDSILGVYRALRAMLEEHPSLVIALVVHLRKPSGRGERRISDVLGEWGRWCDVLLLMEDDGHGKVKLTSRKRIRQERRILATKRGGLLVDPVDLGEGTGPKVPLDEVVSAIAAQPGIGAKELGLRLNVSKDTAQRYAAAGIGAGVIRSDRRGERGAYRYWAGDESEAELLAQLGGVGNAPE
jgi:hypothetical protein